MIPLYAASGAIAGVMGLLVQLLGGGLGLGDTTWQGGVAYWAQRRAVRDSDFQSTRIASGTAPRCPSRNSRMGRGRDRLPSLTGSSR